MDKIKAAKDKYPWPYSEIEINAFIAGWDAALSTQSPKWVKVADRQPPSTIVDRYHTKVKYLDYDDSILMPSADTFSGEWECDSNIEVIEWLDESPSSTHPLQEKIDGLSKLFGYLAEYGGKIVCSNELSSEWINQARASGRMYVDDNSIGYIWEPEIKNFPETEEEVLFLEKWYPLKFELPESLKTLDWLHKPINKQP